MKQIVIFFTQAYLHLIPERTWKDVAAKARLILAIHKDDQPHPAISSFFSEVIYAPGIIEPHCPPVLDVDFVEAALRNTIPLNDFDNSSISILCQGEFNLFNAANLRARLGLLGDTPDLARIFRDKICMKKTLEGTDICLPKYVEFSHARASKDPIVYYSELVFQLGKPLVVKPTMSAGSYGVSIIWNEHDFFRAARNILDQDSVIPYEVDEFISGELHQCDSFTDNGRVLFAGVAKLNGGNFDFIQGKPLAMLPVVDQRVVEKIRLFNDRVINSLGFTTGCTHLEFFVRNGECVFLEIAARIPGAIGVPFHEKNSQLNLLEEYVRAIAKLAPITPPGNAFSRADHVLAWLPTGAGKIVALNEPSLYSEFSIDWKVEIGQLVDCQSLGDTAGMLTLRNPDYSRLLADFNELTFFKATTTAL